MPLAVVVAAEPDHLERLAVVFMVGLTGGVTALRARQAHQATGGDGLLHLPAGGELLGIGFPELALAGIVARRMLPAPCLRRGGCARPAVGLRDTLPAHRPRPESRAG